MNQDALKSAWQSLPPEKSHVSLKSIIRERHRPIMNRIRIQIIIETTAFTLFLLVFNDFFDGDQKPIYATWLLGSALAFAILSNLIWYKFIRFHPTGNNISELLHRRIAAMKTYAWISIGSRIFLALSLLLFFTTVITLSATKYWILAGIISVFIVQMALLIRVWTRRISRLSEIYDSFIE